MAFELEPRIELGLMNPANPASFPSPDSDPITRCMISRAWQRSSTWAGLGRQILNLVAVGVIQ